MFKSLIRTMGLYKKYRARLVISQVLVLISAIAIIGVALRVPPNRMDLDRLLVLRVPALLPIHPHHGVCRMVRYGDCPDTVQGIQLAPELFQAIAVCIRAA